MEGAAVTASIKGLENIQKMASQALSRRDLAARAVGDAHLKKTFQRFKSNKVQGPPLKAATIKRKKSSVKLVDTSRLARSIRFRTMTGLSMMWFTNVIYAGVHQYGYKNIPQRKFLFFTTDDLRLYAKIYMRALFR